MLLHTFLAAADLEKFVIVLHIPFISETKFLKVSVERNAVTIAFGINDDAILSKNTA
ncbi:MAG: hypothetical protein U0Z26_02890 [Anaerolineales bacterium]